MRLGGNTNMFSFQRQVMVIFIFDMFELGGKRVFLQ